MRVSKSRCYHRWTRDPVGSCWGWSRSFTNPVQRDKKKPQVEIPQHKRNLWHLKENAHKLLLIFNSRACAGSSIRKKGGKNPGSFCHHGSKKLPPQREWLQERSGPRFRGRAKTKRKSEFLSSVQAADRQQSGLPGRRWAPFLVPCLVRKWGVLFFKGWLHYE